jgi:plastocyanin
MKRFLQLSVLVFLTTISVSSFAQTKVIVTFGNFAYNPETLPTLSVGDTIEWRGNFGSHPLSSDTIPAGALPFGQTSGTTPYQYIVEHVGFYSFMCTFHKDRQPEPMRGRFIAVPNSVKNAPSAHGIKLEQNYPNPVSGQTSIGFSLEKATDLTISLYTSTGEFVKSLASGTFDGGKQSVTLDASTLPNGVYFYRLNANGETLAGQMVVTK